MRKCCGFPFCPCLPAFAQPNRIVDVSAENNKKKKIKMQFWFLRPSGVGFCRASLWLPELRVLPLQQGGDVKLETANLVLGFGP